MSRTKRKCYVSYITDHRRYDGKILKEYWDKDSKNRKASHSCLNHGGCSWCEGNRLYGKIHNMPTFEEFEEE